MEAEVLRRMAALEERHWWFRGRRRILDTLIERHAPGHRPLRILEAGCGSGGNLSMLARFGEVSAFELDAGARQAARARGFSVEAGALPEAHPFLQEAFDLIALFDVLEHVREDFESLVALRRQLRPGGLFILTVPAFPFLWSAHDARHHHFRRYRRGPLRHALLRAGFRVERISYFNTWLFPAIASVRLVKKALRSPGSDAEHLPPLWLNGFLESLFSSERHFLLRGALPFGVSLVAMATAGPEKNPA